MQKLVVGHDTELKATVVEMVWGADQAEPSQK
jgi:hypothetical protein